MPRNPSGTGYTVPNTFSPGTKAYSAQVNQNFQDIGTELVNSLPRDGRAPMTGPLAMGGNRITGLPDPVDPGDAVPLSKIGNLAVEIGDGAWSIRDLSPDWLRRNGAVYPRSAYPELAALLPVLPDSVTWGSGEFDVAVPSGYSCRGIAQLGSMYVALFTGSPGTCIYSSDDRGKTWTQRYSDNIYYGTAILAGVNEFAAFQADANTNTARVVRSLDGVSWSGAAVPGSATPNYTSILIPAYFDGEYYLLKTAGGGNNYVHRSADGVTWATSSLPGAGNLIVASPDMALALGGGSLYQSVDHGENWSTLGSNPFSTYNPSVGAYEPDRGLYIYGGQNPAGAILTAPDGLTLTSRHTVANPDWYRISANANGIAAAGFGGAFSLSSDGLSYTNFSVPGSGAFGGVLVDEEISGRVLAGRGDRIYFGTRVSPTQFRVPDDDPTNGWIRAA